MTALNAQGSAKVFPQKEILIGLGYGSKIDAESPSITYSSAKTMICEDRTNETYVSKDCKS